MLAMELLQLWPKETMPIREPTVDVLKTRGPPLSPWQASDRSIGFLSNKQSKLASIPLGNFDDVSYWAVQVTGSINLKQHMCLFRSYYSLVLVFPVEK